MIQVRIRPEFERDYLEIEPGQWYDVVLEVLDRVVLCNQQLYLARKFEVRRIDGQA